MPVLAKTDSSCKVSHANRRPILFLPDRAQHPGLPTGWTDVSIERETYEANFVKIALNVVRRKGSDANELPGILRRWFGPNAGLPGTDFRVALDCKRKRLRARSTWPR